MMGSSPQPLIERRRVPTLEELEVTGALSKVFEELLNRDTLFVNREVLRSTHTPESLPHREKEVNHLANVLVAALRGQTPSNVLIYGKTGTGKTAVAKFVGKELELMGEKMGAPLSVLYVNCKVVDTQYRLLANLASYFGREVPMTGWPTDQVYEEFRQGVDAEARIAIIVLDEIDKLIRKGDDVLYNLSRINDNLSRSKVSLIGISNDLRFTEQLDPRVRSSLGEEEIIFPPYNAAQIADILTQRAKVAFKPGALDPNVIPLCSAFAAHENGDARRALDLLRVSAELAEREGAERVTEAHVRMAQDRIEEDRITVVVRTLPTQSKLVLSSIAFLSSRGAKTMTTGEVYSVYKKLCSKIDVDILTQRRITDLLSELDMLGIVNATVISKGRYGRTKEISLTTPWETIFKTLTEDYRLKMLASLNPSFPTQSKLDCIPEEP
ncbi:MAG: archaeal cell division control protein 6 [Methanosarcinales archaeon]|nr:MAG: ORC1-type DNA replication protein [Euryarchaeota archaeon 55_53]KUK30586.1 MAG: ORC1-type DNA replication protein [Methanosarcinales archeaon 56_1174]MDI3488113.1 archaeal cell division control protein 6 [Methanosarcinales archaeon]MDN5295688.1 archaeal cell division control protein 6 [Methanosarcinales archaeon]